MTLKALDAVRKIIANYQTQREQSTELTLGQTIAWALRTYDFKKIEAVFGTKSAESYAFYKSKFFERLEIISDENFIKAIDAYFNE